MRFGCWYEDREEGGTEREFSGGECLCCLACMISSAPLMFSFSSWCWTESRGGRGRVGKSTLRKSCSRLISSDVILRDNARDFDEDAEEKLGVTDNEGPEVVHWKLREPDLSVPEGASMCTLSEREKEVRGGGEGGGSGCKEGSFGVGGELCDFAEEPFESRT